MWVKGMFATDAAAIWLEYSGEGRWCVNVEILSDGKMTNTLYKDLSYGVAKGLKEDIIILWS